MALEKEDMAAIKLLWSYMDGTPVQTVKNEGDSPETTAIANLANAVMTIATGKQIPQPQTNLQQTVSPSTSPEAPQQAQVIQDTIQAIEKQPENNGTLPNTAASPDTI